MGRADITGPVVEVEFAGYADLNQIGTGLRQRLYSRAFIVGDVANPDDRFVYLVLDVAAGDTAQRYGILEGLAALGDDYAVYGQSNVAVTGTHSHNGPGAWWNYLLVSLSLTLVSGCVSGLFVILPQSNTHVTASNYKPRNGPAECECHH